MAAHFTTAHIHRPGGKGITMRKGLFAGLLAAAMLAAAPAPAQQTTPEYIPLQGQLTEQSIAGGGSITAEDGVYTITVRVYESPTGSGAIWEDTFENLPVVNGVFNMVLGSQRSLDAITGGSSGEDLLDRLAQRGVMYVGLVITHKDGTTIPQPVEMLPRLTLLPVALSLKSREAINSQLLDNKHWDLFFNGTKAKSADTLDGYDLTAFVTIPPGATEGSSTQLPEGTRLSERLLPPEANPGTLLAPGAILEFYGGAIDAAVDPRSLDTGWDRSTNQGGDGIPDKPFSEAENLRGELLDVEREYQLWFVLQQNEAGSLRFPDPQTEGLSMQAVADYSTIHASLQGQRVPANNRPAIVDTFGSETYEWRELQVSGNSMSEIDNSYSGEPSIAYDPILDAYWYNSNVGSTNLSLIWRDPNDDSRYLLRNGIAISGAIHNIGGSGDSVKLTVVPDAPGTGSHLLITGISFAGKPMVSEVSFSQTGGVPDYNSVSLTYRSIAEGTIVVRRQYEAVYATGYGYTTVGGTEPDLTNLSHSFTLMLENDELVSLDYDFDVLNGGKSGPAGAFDPGTSKAYFFGGVGSSVWSSQILRWDPTQPDGSDWSELSATGTIPSGRAYAAACINPLNGSLVIFGGGNLGGRLNELYAYNPAENVWTNFTNEQSAIRPAARYIMGYTLDTKRNRLIVLGGYDGGGNKLTDLWELDFGGDISTSAWAIKVNGDF